MDFKVENIYKYILEGLVVALAAFYIPQRNMEPKEIALIALTAAVAFGILDFYSLGVAAGQGSQIGIGYNLSRGKMAGGCHQDPKETYLRVDNVPYNLQDDNVQYDNVQYDNVPYDMVH